MATQGPNYPSAAVSAVSGTESSDAWTTPTNVFSDNGTESTIVAASYDSPDIGQQLRVSGFGFSIPAGSTIDGITVEIERRSIIANSGKDFRVQLQNPVGTTIGNNLAVPATIWPTAATVATYGGATNLWGATLTPTIVNDSAFGVILSAQANIANADIGVDFIRMTVHYTPPPVDNRNGPMSLVSHGHTVAFAGRKGGRGTLAVSHGHTVNDTGRKTARGTLSTGAGHTVTYSGSKTSETESHSGALTVTHSHTVTYTGHKAQAGTLSVANGHTVSTTGHKAISRAISVSHGHSVSVVGRRGGTGSLGVSQGVVVTVDGRKGARGVLTVTHPLDVSVGGRKGGRGVLGVSQGQEVTFSGHVVLGPAFDGTLDVSHGHAVVFAGHKSTGGAFSVVAAPEINAQGRKAGSGVFMVEHGYAIAATGHAVLGPPVPFHGTRTPQIATRNAPSAYEAPGDMADRNEDPVATRNV